MARLKKRNLKPADKILCNYDQQPFKLDGRMELTIAFGDKEMSTQVYIKLDAADQLLLSDSVCRLLDIVTYIIQQWRNGEKVARPMSSLKLLLTPQQSKHLFLPLKCLLLSQFVCCDIRVLLFLWRLLALRTQMLHGYS